MAYRGTYEDSSESVPLVGVYDRRLPFFGCGIGWFSFLLGIIFPLAWYYATFLYLSDYYQYEPRERAGLGACAIAALICTVVIIIVALIMLL